MGLQPVVSKAPGTGGLYPCLEPSFTTPGGDVNSLITIGTKLRPGQSCAKLDAPIDAKGNSRRSDLDLRLTITQRRLAYAGLCEPSACPRGRCRVGPKAVGGWLKEQLGFGLRPDQLKQDGEYNGQRRGIPVDQPRLVAQRGPCDGEQGARAGTRQTACTCIRDLRPAHACAYHFFRVISLSTSISRS